MAAVQKSQLRRAARQRGISYSVLLQQGWETASPERIKSIADNPPDWLVKARERREVKRFRKQRVEDRKDTAVRLGIQARAVAEHEITPADVGDLLAAPPSWLIEEQARRQAQIDREAKDRLCHDLSEALVTSVHEVWFRELKRAATDTEVVEIDKRWAPEVGRAKREARRLVDELTPEQVGARIGREGQAARDAARYRATQLARRAFRDAGGR
jgi:hypothetical protein